MTQDIQDIVLSAKDFKLRASVGQGDRMGQGDRCFVPILPKAHQGDGSPG